MLEGALHLLCGGSVEDVLQVSRSIAAMATFWLGLAKAGHCAPPPSRLILVVTSPA
jgi:hypothetical protein